MLVHLQASVFLEVEVGQVLEVIGLRSNAYTQDYYICGQSLAVLELDATDSTATLYR